VTLDAGGSTTRPGSTSCPTATSWVQGTQLFRPDRTRPSWTASAWHARKAERQPDHLLRDTDGDGRRKASTRRPAATAVGPGRGKLYVTVESVSNVGDYGIGEERRRACILEIDPDGGNERLYGPAACANPVGLDCEPETGAMWTAVNEGDELGDDLLHRLRHSAREGAFYGWPYAYCGSRTRAGGRARASSRRRFARTLPWARTASLGLASTAAPRSRSATGRDVPASTARGTGQLPARGRLRPVRGRAALQPMEDFLTGFGRDAAAASGGEPP
jgi:glucose/arabinose dehydrogenase